MDDKLKKSFQDELALSVSRLGNYNPDDPEYGKTLAAITKLTTILAEDDKAKRDSERFALEIQKVEETQKLEKSKLSLDKRRFEHQVEQDENKHKLDELNITLAMKNVDLNLAKVNTELKELEINAEMQRRSEKTKLILMLIGTLGGLMIEGIAIAAQISMGNKSLALEYADNGITPKKTSEAIRNLNDFVRKKH